MLCTEIVSDIQDNFCTQHVLSMFCKKKSFWQRFTCIENEEDNGNISENDNEEKEEKEEEEIENGENNENDESKESASIESADSIAEAAKQERLRAKAEALALRAQKAKELRLLAQKKSETIEKSEVETSDKNGDDSQSENESPDQLQKGEYSDYLCSTYLSFSSIFSC